MPEPLQLARALLRVLLLVALAGGAAVNAAERRVALVIGNSDYQTEARLANPVNDARLLAQVLRSQGFRVDEKANLGKRDMELALSRFVRDSAGADAAVIYYAGHGAQPTGGGRNFLLPVDARVEGDDTLETDGVAADRIVEQLERQANPARLRLVVLDACRNNRMAGRSRSGVRGLARMSPGDDFTLVAFSTNDQEVALDGNGSNSPYAQALARHLARAAELPLRRIFELTASDVRAATGQKQRPRTYGDLDSRILLDGNMLSAVASNAPEATANSAQVERQAWEAAQRANSAAAYAAYLREYPAGVYAAAARVARAAAGGDVQPASNGSAAGNNTASSTPPPATVAAPRKEKVTFAADVFFSPRSNGIAGESATKLDDLARRVPAITLEVIIAVGHASTADGGAEASMQISKARAEAVKSYLVSRHPIEPRRIYTEGKGQSQPVADNTTPEGRAKNQRVEIEVVGTRTSG